MLICNEFFKQFSTAINLAPLTGLGNVPQFKS